MGLVERRLQVGMVFLNCKSIVVGSRVYIADFVGGNLAKSL